MKIDHVQLACPAGGEKDARRFFGEMLGMTEEEKPEPLRSRGGCWFRQGEAILHIGVEKEFSPATKAHPAFVVDNAQELAKRLQAAGHPVKWDDSLSGRPRFYTADPFGNRIEFFGAGDGFGDR